MKMYGKMQATGAASVLLLFVGLVSTQTFPPEKIAVGAIFDQNTDEIQAAFKFAMMQHNQNASGKRLELQAYVDVINTADAFKLSRLICNQFGRGVYSMLGAVTPDSFDTLHSYTNTFQMPFVTPWFPEKVIPPSSGLIDHAVSMRTNYYRAVVDVIAYYKWQNIIYIYDSHDGLLRLQQLYQTIQPGSIAFHILYVKRINNSSEALNFLRVLEEKDRWGNKRIVLDCSTRMAKDILISHVRDVRLGRRTYHYLLSGLIMDDRWESEVVEFGAVNITGFRIVDFSRKVVRDFFDGWRKMEPRGRDTISAQAALMYDGVQVLIDALSRLQRKKPEVFRGSMRRSAQINGTKGVDCNPGKGWVTPFEHGDKISRLIKKTELEGVTGGISFNEDGHRFNFSLQVVEMTVNSAMVKVATWSDLKGLSLIPVLPSRLQSPTSFEQNKTYTVATTLKEPFLVKLQNAQTLDGNHKFEGLCKDLADLIASKLGIKYEFKLVKDEKFGTEQPDGSWNGVVGEVLRKEADFGVAPVMMTKERQTVVDFSEPFIIIGVPSPSNTDTQPSNSIFSFLTPLSKEIWLCALFSFFAVSIVLFLVSRFSPYEWRSVSVTDAPTSEPPGTASPKVTLTNEFNILNSMWFSLGSFLQQGSDITPRSVSGRIVGTVWWFFALVLISSYTANLSAYLTAEKIYQTYPQHSQAKNSNFVLASSFADDGDPEYPSKPLKRHFCVDQTGIERKEFGIITAIGSPLRESINMAIVSLQESKELHQIINKWWTKSPCHENNKQDDIVSELTLNNVAGVFYLLLCGLALALLVALMEFCHHSRSEAGDATVPIRTALKAKARLKASPETLNSKPIEANRNERERLPWNGSAFAGYYAANGGDERNAQAGFTQV